MTTTSAEFELVAKYVPEGSSVRAEEALWLALQREKQQIVFRRLQVLDRYLSVSEPTSADASRFAVELDMSVRNFYRLVAKLRERGPVMALSPNYRIQQRPSAASDGLGDVAESALTHLLQTEPDVRWKRAIEVVRNACASAKIDGPSEAAIRRRLLALRTSGAVAPRKSAQFGREWLMDQTAIALPIEGESGIRYAVPTMLVDRATRLIAGVGLSTGVDASSGVLAAVQDATDRLPAFAGFPVDLAPRLREFDWIVPEGLEAKGSAWMMNVVHNVPRTITSISSLGPRRHGENLLRLLGGRLGPYAMMIRATANPEVARDALEIAPVTQEKAVGLVLHAVLNWNQRILNSFDGEMPTARAIKTRQRRLVETADLLVDLFGPVLGEPSNAALQELKSGPPKRSRSTIP